MTRYIKFLERVVYERVWTKNYRNVTGQYASQEILQDGIYLLRKLSKSFYIHCKSNTIYTHTYIYKCVHNHTYIYIHTVSKHIFEDLETWNFKNLQKWN